MHGILRREMPETIEYFMTEPVRFPLQQIESAHTSENACGLSVWLVILGVKGYNNIISLGRFWEECTLCIAGVSVQTFR